MARGITNRRFYPFAASAASMSRSFAGAPPFHSCKTSFQPTQVISPSLGQKDHRSASRRGVFSKRDSARTVAAGSVGGLSGGVIALVQQGPRAGCCTCDGACRLRKLVKNEIRHKIVYLCIMSFILVLLVQCVFLSSRNLQSLVSTATSNRVGHSRRLAVSTTGGQRHRNAHVHLVSVGLSGQHFAGVRTAPSHRVKFTAKFRSGRACDRARWQPSGATASCCLRLR